MADTLTVYEMSSTSTAEITVATVSTGQAFIIQGFAVSNANAATKYFSLKLSDMYLAYQQTLESKKSYVLSGLNIPVLQTKTIKTTQEVASDLDFYIWGLTVDV